VEIYLHSPPPTPLRHVVITKTCVNHVTETSPVSFPLLLLDHISVQCVVASLHWGTIPPHPPFYSSGESSRGIKFEIYLCLTGSTVMIHGALGALVLPLLLQRPVKDNLSKLC
jgi:hypothetical protein